MALQDLWLEGIDVDAALYDIRDDDTQAWEVRALAGASIGIDPIAGLRAVIELRTAMERIVRGENDGKAQLASILGRAGDDYRSEEHKSELQSLMRISYAVFCLKNKTNED